MIRQFRYTCAWVSLTLVLITIFFFIFLNFILNLSFIAIRFCFFCSHYLQWRYYSMQAIVSHIEGVSRIFKHWNVVTLCLFILLLLIRFALFVGFDRCAMKLDDKPKLFTRHFDHEFTYHARYHSTNFYSTDFMVIKRFWICLFVSLSLSLSIQNWFGMGRIGTKFTCILYTVCDMRSSKNGFIHRNDIHIVDHSYLGDLYAYWLFWPRFILISFLEYKYFWCLIFEIPFQSIGGAYDFIHWANRMFANDLMKDWPMDYYIENGKLLLNYPMIDINDLPKCFRQQHAIYK